MSWLMGLLMMGSALATEPVEAHPASVSVKRRDVWPVLPDSVTERLVCAVEVTVGPDGLPVQVGPGDCPADVAQAAQALMGWIWYPPRYQGREASVQFKFRMEMTPSIRLPWKLEEGWARNQALVSFRLAADDRTDGRCRTAVTVHPDGTLSGMRSSSEEGVCRFGLWSKPTKPRRRLVRGLDGRVTCHASFTAVADDPVTMEAIEGCSDAWAEEVERVLGRWEWFPGQYTASVTFVSEGR